MLDKFLLAMIPACVTFGPLFMTRIAGTAAPEKGNSLVTTGTFMVSVGLMLMYRTMQKQQKRIREMEERLGVRE